MQARNQEIILNISLPHPHILSMTKYRYFMSMILISPFLSEATSLGRPIISSLTSSLVPNGLLTHISDPFSTPKPSPCYRQVCNAPTALRMPTAPTPPGLHALPTPTASSAWLTQLPLCPVLDMHPILFTCPAHFSQCSWSWHSLGSCSWILKQIQV